MPGPQDVVPLTPDEDAFFRAFARSSVRVGKALDDDLQREHRMSLSEYLCLVFLSEAPDRALRMHELAAATALTASGISRVVTRLEAAGLARRERPACDGRGATARLTDAGLARLRAVWPSHVASVRRHAVRHVPADHLSCLAEVLGAMGRVAGDADPVCDGHGGGAPT